MERLPIAWQPVPAFFAGPALQLNCAPQECAACGCMYRLEQQTHTSNATTMPAASILQMQAYLQLQAYRSTPKVCLLCCQVSASQPLFAMLSSRCLTTIGSCADAGMSLLSGPSTSTCTWQSPWQPRARQQKQHSRLSWQQPLLPVRV